MGGVYGERLNSASININFKGNYWLVENIDSSKKHFVAESFEETVIVRLKSYLNPSKVFSHEYDMFGNH